MPSKKTDTKSTTKKNTNTTKKTNTKAKTTTKKTTSTVKKNVENKTKDKTVTNTKPKIKTNVKKQTQVSKNTKKNTSKKSTTKKVPKFTTIPNIKEEKKKEEPIKKKSLIDKIKTKFLKKDNKNKKNTKVKSNIKINKNKKSNTKKPIKKKEFNYKKAKKALIIFGIVCLVIILIEGTFMIIHKINVDKHSIYYDTLNSVVLDGSDVVAVGSSDFNNSKYNSYTGGYEKGKIIKYDNDGKVVFETKYENGYNTTFTSVISVGDGYIVVGSGEFSEEEQNNESREAIILKYDKDGNLVWEKFYQVLTNTKFNKVIEVSDGYIAIGQSIYANMEMGNHTTGGGIIVKYDTDGNEVWHNNHGGTKSGNFNDIVEVDGSLYVVGKDATDYGNIVKYSSDGTYEWHKNYSYTDSLGLSGITYSKNYLYVVGSKKVLPEDTTDDSDRTTTNTDGVIIKYDLDGNIVEEKTFGGSSYERYNSIVAYGNYLYVIGHTTSEDAGLSVDTDGTLMTGLFIKYDRDCNINKKFTLGGSNNDNLTDIITDGVTLYITGYSNSKDGSITTNKSNGKDYIGLVITLGVNKLNILDVE